MDIYLKKTDSDLIRFPILPGQVGLSTSSNLQNEHINGLGEVVLFGGNKLKKVDLSSMFPNKEYRFNQYSNVPKPYDFIVKLQQWKDEGRVLRYIVTGTNINLPVMIESFEYSEKDITRDVYFSLSLIEHKGVTINKKPVGDSNSGSDNNTDRPTETKPPTQKTHTVVKGDCMWNIAKKYYGKGTLWTKVRDANTTKYPSLKKNTIIYPGWVMVIP